jgi:diaminopropionate ammonia-lyase
MSSMPYLNASRQPPAISRRAQEIAAQLGNKERTREIASLFGAPTPLVQSISLAKRLGIGELWMKDERARGNLGSFKALGGMYAVATLAAEALSRRCRRTITPGEVFKGDAPPANHLTFATATAGNHGCSVAHGAKLAGASAIIFIHESVSEARAAAIAAQGAQIVRVAGDYEAAVTTCAQECRANEWLLVSDFAEAGYQNIPLRVMQGYSVLAAEALEQSNALPTHVFVQAGVGGLAASLTAYCAAHCDPAPRTIIVEASGTRCLQESARHSRLMVTEPTEPTVMGRLECRKPSSLAWPLLAHQATAFAAVEDESALEAARDLHEQGVPTTPSGAAGLAGLKHTLRDASARKALHLGPESRVLIIVTEQADTP